MSTSTGKPNDERSAMQKAHDIIEKMENKDSWFGYAEKNLIVNYAFHTQNMDLVEKLANEILDAQFEHLHGHIDFRVLNRVNDEIEALSTSDVKENFINDPNVKEFLKILSENNQMIVPIQQFNDLVSQVSAMEERLYYANRGAEMAHEAISMMLAKKHPISEALSNAVSNIEGKVAEIQSKLDSLKQFIIDGVKKVVEAVKQEGLSALNDSMQFLKIKDGLSTVSKALSNAEKNLNVAVNKLEQLEQKAQKPSIMQTLQENKKEIAEKAPNPLIKPQTQMKAATL